jgi:hypothetical protein
MCPFGEKIQELWFGWHKRAFQQPLWTPLAALQIWLKR